MGFSLKISYRDFICSLIYGMIKLKILYRDFICWKRFIKIQACRASSYLQLIDIWSIISNENLFLESVLVFFESPGIQHTYSSNDDDFVKMPPIKVSKLNIVGKKTLRAKSEKRQDSLRKLNTRFPPEHITKTMAMLNNHQRACVESIGFGEALTMQLTKLPRKLCYWVVNNYDPNTNSIRLKDQRLKIKREIVHQIYGIPTGDIPMSNPSKSNPENHVVKLWKSQFPITLKRIRLTNVVEMIRNDTTAGPFFVLNFLVLFVSVMMEYPTMGTVNQGFLENVGDVLDIKQLDWCGFVISSLKSSDVDDTTSMRDCPVSEGFTENVVQQILGKCDDSNSIELVTKRNHEFNLACPKISTSDDFHDPTLFNGVLTPVMHDGSNTTESKHAQIQKETVQDDVQDEIVFATPFSQLLDAEAFDIMEKAALAACSKTSKQESVSPDHRGSQLIIHVGNVDPVTVVAPRRTKRHVQPTEKFRSPYFKRVVNPNKLLTSNEERVSGWIFAGLDNEWDLVFESIFGDLGYRGIFESMIPGSKIHATCIDIWASILNHQERYRNKKSPARMFLSCTLLVFFPVIDIEHYYLVVFDFKKHDCVIIDNINSKESDEGKYGNIHYDLKILFTLYGDELNHKKANHIKRSKPMSGCMKWTTKYNSIDCGVFLMRHMETYKGEDFG
ncbi:hypothetical protein L2E82_08035 [Cichorium intybus]|uniref:Uncharacterized protein n=1 Tax=Cichorium intybus TaxID=13427 RepID=A0ACB9G6G7_CICIN|nr:hypothetical protein L2E82_08035 [Cichorium intybus]